MKKALPKIVSRREWEAARKKLLAKEKKATRARDELNAQRRRLPMYPMNGDTVFTGPEGKISFLDLFDGRDQLLIYHFMYHPQNDSFCSGCSFMADQLPELSHVRARGTNVVMTSDAPLKSIRRHRKRMGWDIPWYSVLGTGFNEEIGIDGNRQHALSAFLRDGKKIYRTYVTTGRGVEYVASPWSLLDLTAYGRREIWEDSPKGWPQSEPYVWWRFHDEYAGEK